MRLPWWPCVRCKNLGYCSLLAFFTVQAFPKRLPLFLDFLIFAVVFFAIFLIFLPLLVFNYIVKEFSVFASYFLNLLWFYIFNTLLSSFYYWKIILFFIVFECATVIVWTVPLVLMTRCCSLTSLATSVVHLNSIFPSNSINRANIQKNYRWYGDVWIQLIEIEEHADESEQSSSPTPARLSNPPHVPWC